MNYLKNFIENNKGKLYLLLVLLVLTDRFFVLHYFGFRYTGSDDAVLWLGAKEYMHGIFREPFFYGQDYNYMAEALLAVPLLFFGVDAGHALPATTSLMTLFPFFCFSYTSYRNKNFAGVFILMAIPLLLPIQYEMMTSMSRGFINGIFFVSFIPLLMEKPSRLRFFLTGVCTAVAVAVNPNSLVLLVPIMTYYFFQNIKSRNFYIFILLGFIPPIGLHQLALNFYVTNPGYKIHELSAWRLAFHSELIPECFGKFDKLFKYLMPVFTNGGAYIFYFLLLLCVLLFVRKKYMYAVCSLSALAVLMYSFGLAKIQDGFDDLLLPLPRMFLAVPIFYGILISWLLEKSKYANLILAGTFLLSLIFFIKKSSETKEKIARLVYQQQWSPLLIYPVNALKCDCEKFTRLAEENNAQLIAGVEIDCRGHYLATLFFGCSVMNNDFPPAIFPEHDRRRWRFLEEEKSVRKNILFIGGNADFWNKISQKGYVVKKIAENPFVCLLENNNVTTIDLFHKLEIPVRQY